MRLALAPSKLGQYVSRPMTSHNTPCGEYQQYELVTTIIVTVGSSRRLTSATVGKVFSGFIEYFICAKIFYLPVSVSTNMGEVLKWGRLYL